MNRFIYPQMMKCLITRFILRNPGDTQPFKQAVYEQVKIYAEKGLPKRAEMLRKALVAFYGTEDEIDLAKFDVMCI